MGQSAAPGQLRGHYLDPARMRFGHCHSQATRPGRAAHPHKAKHVDSRGYSSVAKEGNRDRTSHAQQPCAQILRCAGQLLPVEADPADWAEQQLSVPLPDDEYPHLGGDRRVLISMSGGADVD